MYDAIYPKNIPADAQIVASYVDGKWPNYSQAVALFPEALHVSIAAFPEDDAMALDVEQYDATPQQAPGWAARQRKRGYAHPIVYMSAAVWPQVRSEFHKQGVPEPLYWVADYDGVRSIPDGAIAKQFQGTTAPGFDLSAVADYVPGLDGEDMALTTDDVGRIAHAVWAYDQQGVRNQAWAYLRQAADPSMFARAIVAALPKGGSAPLTEADIEAAVRKVFADAAS